MNENREQFKYIDAEEDAIEMALAEISQDFVTSSDIAFHMGVQDLVRNRKLAKKIKYVMDNHPGWRTGQKRVMGIPKRGYRRIVASE